MSSKNFWDIKFSAGSLEDLVEIIQYILENDGVESAKELSSLIQTDAKKRLTTLPYRGHIVPELEYTGVECREIHIKSYRIIYKPVEADHTVFILMIAHARRSIQDMLRKCILGCNVK